MILSGDFSPNMAFAEKFLLFCVTVLRETWIRGERV